MSIAITSPTTGKTGKTFTPATDDEFEAALSKAKQRYDNYRKTSFTERADWMCATAHLLEDAADDVGSMLTLEMGKGLASAKAEALKCTNGFRHYAEHAAAMLADQPANADALGGRHQLEIAAKLPRRAICIRRFSPGQRFHDDARCAIDGARR